MPRQFLRRLKPRSTVLRWRQHRGVAGLARCQRHGERAAELVGQCVDLRGPPATRTPQGMASGFAGQILVIRSCPHVGRAVVEPAPAACWWARTLVESTDSGAMCSSPLHWSMGLGRTVRMMRQTRRSTSARGDLPALWLRERMSSVRLIGRVYRRSASARRWWPWPPVPAP
jgi:hypothetical protein